MEVIPVTTRVFQPPRDDLFRALDESLPPLVEGDVLAVTSKVVAIHQGRCLRISDVPSKDDLIAAEAERYLPRSACPGALAMLTIKGHTILSSAGVDASNANGYYVLWPENINAAAREIRQYLQRKFSVERLAVIITDSHSVPLRNGAVGVAIGYHGLEPLHDYVGTLDLFGRSFHAERANLIDGLAAAAVLAMGEGSEQTPLAIVRGVPGLAFTDRDTSAELFPAFEDDIFYPLLQVFTSKEPKD